MYAMTNHIRKPKSVIYLTILFLSAVGLFALFWIYSSTLDVPFTATAQVQSTPEWTVVPSPVTYTLYSVSMVSPNDGWAVGSDVDADDWYPNLDNKNAALLRWNGTSWNPVSYTSSSVLRSVDMVSANDGWAVGKTKDNPYTGQSLILHWDGINWNTVNPPLNSNQTLRSVAMVSSNDGWAVGGDRPTSAVSLPCGDILHWNGNEWRRITCVSNSVLTSIAIVSPNDIWAVGIYFELFGSPPTQYWYEYGGVQAHWDGNFWSTLIIPGSAAYSLLGVSAVSSNDAWAVGYSGYAWHWDGNSWHGNQPITSTLSSVSMVSTDNGWAAGKELLHWDGSAWSIASKPDNASYIRSITMLSSTEGWAVGDLGTILHYSSGSHSQFQTFLPIIFHDSSGSHPRFRTFLPTIAR
jgi:hypothetical protein